jgi:hypothetical protein
LPEGSRFSLEIALSFDVNDSERALVSGVNCPMGGLLVATGRRSSFSWFAGGEWEVGYEGDGGDGGDGEDEEEILMLEFCVPWG